jgi:hypothetical protein
VNNENIFFFQIPTSPMDRGAVKLGITFSALLLHRLATGQDGKWGNGQHKVLRLDKLKKFDLRFTNLIITTFPIDSKKFRFFAIFIKKKKQFLSLIFSLKLCIYLF